MPTDHSAAQPSVPGDASTHRGAQRLDDVEHASHNPPMAAAIQHSALTPLKAKFPDTKFLVGEFRDMVTVVVPREAISEVATYLRDDPICVTTCSRS